MCIRDRVSTQSTGVSVWHKSMCLGEGPVGGPEVPQSKGVQACATNDSTKPVTRSRGRSWSSRQAPVVLATPSASQARTTRPRANSWPPKKSATSPAWLRYVSLWLHQLRGELLDTESQFGDGGVAPLGDVLLPAQTGLSRPTLVLDLDETLCHVDSSKVLKLRPAAGRFLEEVAEMYEVVIYTAAERWHADPILDELERSAGVPFAHRLYREHCQELGAKGAIVKDLRRIGRDMRRVLIVDNSPESFVLQPENGVPIESYFGSEHDHVLPQMALFLKKVTKWVAKEGDLRPRIQRCHRRCCFHSPSP
eukprot:TRINITY_DN488_c0_g1_i11.p1 TRINITY_DN488_c0_g1~~TRINITY_DN488_c0_g1_i11.p1  ORF type:complete len:308 (+),score=31.99 TRINITY_DN488_c0_g1_i11:143-1066(+)